MKLKFLIISLLALSGCAAKTLVETSAIDPSEFLRQSPSSATTLGAQDAPLKVAVFQDTNCGMCRKMWRELISQNLKKPLKDGKIQVRFFEFPLGLDPRSTAIAIAAKCAAEQGKYEQFLNAAYTTKGEHDKTQLTMLSRKANLDIDKVSDCINSGVPKQQVSNDVAAGRALNVEGTPTFFINGKRLTKSWIDTQTWNELLRAH